MTSRTVTIVLIVSLVASMLSSLVLGYLWIDRSVSLAYSADSLAALSASRSNLVHILKTDWHGLAMREIEQKLNTSARLSPAFPKLSPVEMEDGRSVLRAGDLKFEFVEGRLRDVH